MTRRCTFYQQPYPAVREVKHHRQPDNEQRTGNPYQRIPGVALNLETGILRIGKIRQYYIIYSRGVIF
jgi:hypothetical protein